MKFMPHRERRCQSVMLSYYPKENPKYDNKEIEEKWQKL